MFRRKAYGPPKRRTGIVWPIAMLLSAVVGGSAFGASPECIGLQAELDRLPPAPGSVVLSQDFAQAADTQQDQIDLARIRAADLGCGRAMSGTTVVACAQLNAKIAAMEANLGSLVGGPAPRPNKNARRERIRIFDAMERAGCNNQQPEDETTGAAPVDPTVHDQIGGTIIRGGSAEPSSFNEEYPQHIVIGRGTSQGTGEYRTLCVRTCDGYAFPMSSSASLSDFQRDQTNCEASCPGTDIELFYHLAFGEAQEDMVSARSGAPYADLATAYRYKRIDLPKVPACGCNVATRQNFSIVGGDGRPIAPVKPAPMADAPAAAPPPQPSPNPDRKIRAVGPAFLPDPQAAIDLQAPARTQAR